MAKKGREGGAKATPDAQKERKKKVMPPGPRPNELALVFFPPVLSSLWPDPRMGFPH